MTTTEQEIDLIFLDAKETIADSTKMKNLTAFSKSMAELTPYLDLLDEKVSGIKMHFSRYNLQLQTLSNEISDIQEQNKDLEDKYAKESLIYETLRALTLALNVDDAHLQILEKGNFESQRDLVKMEEALNILSGFRVDKFTLRLADEMKQKIVNCQKTFFSRFSAFFPGIFRNSKEMGDLRVHKELYAAINQFKFVFAQSRIFKDSFNNILFAYVTNSSAIYKREFESHLTGMQRLIDDPGKLNVAIEILIKSFISLMNVELNFLKNLLEKEEEAADATQKIFKPSDALMQDFMEEMFKKSELATIISLAPLTALKYPAGPVMDFVEGMKEKFTLLKKLFLKNEELRLEKVVKLGNLKQILIQNGLEDIKKTLLKMYINRLTKRIDTFNMQKIFERYRLVYSINVPKDLDMEYLRADALKQISHCVEVQTIEFVFDSENETEKAKELVAMIKDRKSGISECEGVLLNKVRSILLENGNDEIRTKINDIFH